MIMYGTYTGVSEFCGQILTYKFQWFLFEFTIDIISLFKKKHNLFAKYFTEL